MAILDNGGRRAIYFAPPPPTRSSTVSAPLRPLPAHSKLTRPGSASSHLDLGPVGVDLGPVDPTAVGRRRRYTTKAAYRRLVSRALAVVAGRIGGRTGGGRTRSRRWEGGFGGAEESVEYGICDAAGGGVVRGVGWLVYFHPPDGFLLILSLWGPRILFPMLSKHPYSSHPRPDRQSCQSSLGSPILVENVLTGLVVARRLLFQSLCSDIDLPICIGPWN